MIIIEREKLQLRHEVHHLAGQGLDVRSCFAHLMAIEDVCRIILAALDDHRLVQLDEQGKCK